MAHIRDDDEFVTVYDTRTGEKLDHQVPKSHLEIFPNLSKTPRQKSQESKTTPAAKADEKKG